MTGLTKLLIATGVLILLAAGGAGGYLWSKRETGAIQEKKKEPIKEETTGRKKSSRNDPGGPYYHKIYAATSKDGLNWQKQGKILFEHASVPGAVIKEGIIYLYFVDAGGEEDQLSVGISKDRANTFEKYKVEFEETESADAVDPHPELVDGQIRLYYFGGFFELADPAKAESKHKIHSSVSDDGIHFKNQKFAYEDFQITDPDVFKTDKDWRMLISKGRGLDLLTSTDGGITFSKQSGFSWDKGGVSDTFNFNGTYQTFYCGTGIESAVGADKGQLNAEQKSRIAPENQGKIICDPSVIQLPDNSYMMFYKVQDAPKQGLPGQPKMEPKEEVE